MRVYLQWALADPQGWEAHDIDSAADWAALPSKPEPVGGETLDNTPGWLARIDVAGIGQWGGYDHVHFDGTTLTCWNDDPTDWPVGFRFGFQGQQGLKAVWYADENWHPRTLVAESRVVLPFADLAQPADARHGIWMSDAVWRTHEALTAFTNPHRVI